MIRMLLALGAFMNRSKVLDWSMGSLGVAWYATLHLRGAGASAGAPVGPGSASYNNSFTWMILLNISSRKNTRWWLLGVDKRNHGVENASNKCISLHDAIIDIDLM